MMMIKSENDLFPSTPSTTVSVLLCSTTVSSCCRFPNNNKSQTEWKIALEWSYYSWETRWFILMDFREILTAFRVNKNSKNHGEQLACIFNFYQINFTEIEIQTVKINKFFNSTLDQAASSCGVHQLLQIFMRMENDFQRLRPSQRLEMMTKTVTMWELSGLSVLFHVSMTFPKIWRVVGCKDVCWPFWEFHGHVKNTWNLEMIQTRGRKLSVNVKVAVMMASARIN